MNAAAGFPWSGLIAFGLGLLRLPPAQFWALSLAELRHLGAALPSPPPLSRSSLERLMRLFPDERNPQ